MGLDGLLADDVDHIERHRVVFDRLVVLLDIAIATTNVVLGAGAELATILRDQDFERLLVKFDCDFVLLLITIEVPEERIDVGGGEIARRRFVRQVTFERKQQIAAAHLVILCVIVTYA